MSTIYAGTESTLNEMDNEVGVILLEAMQLADMRKDLSGNQLWTKDRIFLNTTQDVDDIFLNRQLQSGESNLSFPFLAYTPDKSFVSVDHAFGNRMNEAGINIEIDKSTPMPYSKTSMIKSVQTKYSVSLWDDDYKSIRYYQDKLMVKILHNKFYHEWESQYLKGHELSFTFTFNIPVINTIPSTSDKLNGKGYIYALGFDVDVWGSVADYNDEENPLIFQVTTTMNGNSNKKSAQDTILMQEVETGEVENEI